MRRESKRGNTSSTMIGRKSLKHVHQFELPWFSPVLQTMVRMCHICGDHEEVPTPAPAQGPTSTGRKPRKPRAPRKPRKSKTG